jgi:serine/threonine protein phosphatase PrpC
MTENTNKIFGITHIGLVRKTNEDRYLIKELNDKSVLIAIADGLGGEVAGDYAAEILRGKLAGLNQITRDNEQAELDQLARAIDHDIYNEGQENNALEGMGTTLVSVLLRDRIAYWVHVGDSRLYLLRNGILTQVTEDQTLARFLLEEGEITAEQLPTHYSRHVMDQCEGCGFVDPETGRLKFRAGDLLVLSTDGLHREISDDALYSILNTDTNLETKAKRLVKAALDAGGKDNITVVMAQG